LALFGLALAQKMEKGKAEAMKTITGQVVDYECCVKSNGKMLGGDHQECAEACINKMNLPIGILTKDKLYIAVASKMASDEARQKLGGLVNKQVKVTGKVFDFRGSPAIAVAQVEEAK
jgi:hypothetical protein